MLLRKDDIHVGWGGGVGKTFASKWEVYWKVYHLCNGFFFFFQNLYFLCNLNI